MEEKANMITEPTLLLDETKCKANIKTMAQKAEDNNLIFRPHFKTHQSHEIGDWFRDHGVDKITVSSLNMARYFMEDGWKDITVAFPVNILEIEKINLLASKIKLNVVIESTESLLFLQKNLHYTVSVFLKIDTGYHRTGLSPDNETIIDTLITTCKNSKYTRFCGFLGHAGHAYTARNIQEIEKIHVESLNIMTTLKKRYVKSTPNLIISTGDTPTCSRMDTFPGADEIRPGNFVFYDLMQWQIGSCDIDQIALAMACPVVAKHQERSQLVIYGGSAHFSSEYIYQETLEKNIYGYALMLHDKGWSPPDYKSYLIKVSQEHGILQVSEEFFEKCAIGDVIGVLPVHACACAHLMKSYQTFDHIIVERFTA